MFLEDTTETGYACTVLEENDVVNFTEVQCLFARNENTMNVSKLVASVKFTDSCGQDTVPSSRAQINFHEPQNMDSTTPATKGEVTEDDIPTEDDRPTATPPTTTPTEGDAQKSHLSWIGGLFILLPLAIQYFR